MEKLPLYTAEKSREIDSLGFKTFAVKPGELMQRAGLFAFQTLLRIWPGARNIVVFCGPGNNGGDGYVIAFLLGKAMRNVTLMQLGSVDKLRGNTKIMAQNYIDAGGKITQLPEEPLDIQADVVVDALLGSGLNRPLPRHLSAWINCLNTLPTHRLSLDVPTGLCSDRGTPMPVAFSADVTVSFISRKQGLYTGEAKNYTGEIVFGALGVPPEVSRQITTPNYLVSHASIAKILPRRKPDAHKGDCGYVLIIGGNHGYTGAALLAAIAAMRAGAGLVRIASRPQTAAAATIFSPVLMTHVITEPNDLFPLFASADAIAIGPGLGHDRWAKNVLECVLNCRNTPLVVDADALRLLFEVGGDTFTFSTNLAVLTPHPGEAGTLLQMDAKKIQSDRYKNATSIARKTNSVCVLKGNGSIISDGVHNFVCGNGTPALATAGSGDVLTGIIAALLAKKIPPLEAGIYGTCIHAKAAELASCGTTEGMLATDLLHPIQTCVNP